ncbi:hypothetical protein ACFLS9_06660 [Bacteroidota bacterium]
MKISEALYNIKSISYFPGSVAGVKTTAEEFKKRINHIKSRELQKPELGIKGNFFLAVIDHNFPLCNLPEFKNIKGEFIYFQLKEDGSGCIISSQPYYLYSFSDYLFEILSVQPFNSYRNGKIIRPSFNWHRISYDYFLTQEGRIQRNFNRLTYVSGLARLGITHVEVNGLGYPMGLETGPKSETYPMFYTYCPALDQFVSSSLNQDLYPEEYLQTNLKYLKENAELAVSYGLTPGLLCFEPRSVPERFFDKYPMLRGARVDHPFRSFKPRYNMTITHPKVREHYSEMLLKLMAEVPELGYLTIWTNDSGAGFEHTKSLYVGRNGGAYLIREWKNDEEIAKLAGENAVRFFTTLRDAGNSINPDFRIITRLESFFGEHNTIWNGLNDGIEVETSSLIAKGWEIPYTHPRYPDSNAINTGTVYQNEFFPSERDRIAELKNKKSAAHYYFSIGPHTMFEPLLGIPYPTLTFNRLKLFFDNGVENLSHIGGCYPQELVPFNVNYEVLRAFQYNNQLNIKDFLKSLASKWTGNNYTELLIKVWELTEVAIFAFPNVTTLYSTFGFTWYRLWARPFVPNIEGISQEERDYYEKFMCTTPHNPNNVDLSRDVLFKLTTLEKSKLDLKRIDDNIWQPLDNAIQLLNDVREESTHTLGENNTIYDYLIRLKALRCWFMTQRNVAAWITGVHGYLNTEDQSEKERNRKILFNMIEKEINNSKELIKLLNTNIEFMAMTAQDETKLVYGSNLKELLIKRIDLMERHKNDEPYIDPEYIEHKAGEMIN